MTGVPNRFETKTMKEVKSPSDMPKSGYMIQFFETTNIHHEGDERSRTHPGHGYPEYTETIQIVRQFATEDKKEWEEIITFLMSTHETGCYAFFAFRRGVALRTTSVVFSTGDVTA